MAEQNFELLEAFKQCKSHLFNFASYKREFLHYRDWLMSNDLNSGLNEKVKGTLRGKRLFTKDLPNAFKLVNSENAEDIAKATAVFYEVLFLIEKALNSMELKKYVFVETEKAAAVQSVYEMTTKQVEFNDVTDLLELQQRRNIFLDKLPLENDWIKRLFVNGYCEGLILSCTVASGIQMELEKAIDLITKYRRVHISTANDERKVRALIRAYAFVFNALNRRRKIDLELVQQIHAIAYEENEGEKILNENEKFGGKIVREPKRLEMLLAWLNLHFLRADYDPVTLAAIAHYGIFLLQPFIDGNHRMGRLIQDYILMSFGYPPVCIFDEDIANYLEKAEESRQYEGTDLRPFFRFISKCLSKTFETILHKQVDNIHLENIVSSSNSLENARIGSRKNTPLSPFNPSNSAEFEPLQEDSNFKEKFNATSSNGSIPNFASSDGSGQSGHSIELKMPLSAQSNVARGNEQQKESSEKEDSKNSPIGDIFNESLAQFNPELIILESPPTNNSLQFTNNNSTGWSRIFTMVLRSINSELVDD